MWLDIVLGIISLLIIIVGGYVTFWPPASKIKKVTFFGAIAGLCALSGVVILAQAQKRNEEQKKQEGILKELQEHNNRLQSNVDRLFLPIKDLVVSFRIDVPLDHADVIAYRRRVETCAQQMADTKSVKCGVDLPFAALADKPVGFNDFCISPGTELYPKIPSEPVAYFSLNTVSIPFEVFQSFPDLQALANRTASPDLSFIIHQKLDSPANKAATYGGGGRVSLCYQMDTKTFYLTGDRIPIDPDYWRANGKVMSIPDFSKVTIAVRPTTFTGVLKETGAGTYDFIQESLTSMQISENTWLRTVTLDLSSGYEIRLPTATSFVGRWAGGRLYVSKDVSVVRAND